MVTVPILLEVPSTPEVIPDQAVAMLGELIPIIAIILGIGVAIVWIYVDYRRKRELYQLYHAERMAAIEKGLELPPLPADFFRDTRVREPARFRRRRWGFVLLFLGVAISVAILGSGGRGGSLWGLVPAGWGLALLLSSHFEAREKASASTASDTNRGSGSPHPPSS